jgi:hypothetical protein
MSTPLKKLSPEVMRELRRHVSAKPLPRTGGGTAAAEQLQGQHKQSLQRILGACVVLTATAATFPLVAHWWTSNKGGLSEKEGALTAPQVRRGAFLNSGTTDIGRDPNWDFSKGAYKKDAGYWAIFQEEKRKNLPGEYNAMAGDNMKKHEENLKAFANGKIKQNGEATNYQ